MSPNITCEACGTILTHIDEPCPNCLPSMAWRPPTKPNNCTKHRNSVGKDALKALRRDVIKENKEAWEALKKGLAKERLREVQTGGDHR